MKFLTLLKKEIKDCITLETIAGIVVFMVIFLALGNVMTGFSEEMAKSNESVVIVDNDASEQSTAAMNILEQAGYKVNLTENEPEVELVKTAKEKYDHSSVLVIPKGYGEGLLSGKAQQLQIVTAVTSFSFFAGTDMSAETAAEIISENTAASLIASKVGNADMAFYKDPVGVTETTVANGKTAQISSQVIKMLGMQQSIFIPMIIFIMVVFAVQLNIAAIANEKTDKTLETLLSTPISRLSVVAAKMCASAVLSIIMAAMYMIGFSSYMGGMMGSASDATAQVNTGEILASLGLQMQPIHYLLLGVDLVLTIMIVLAVSLILGALAKNIKSAQGLSTPIMFIVMIPFFVTMFGDVSTMPIYVQIPLYLIPFTHTFTASSGVLFGGEMTMYILGLVYQLVFLAGVMAVAIKIFSSDRIFTASLSFNKKKKTQVEE